MMRVLAPLALVLAGSLALSGSAQQPAVTSHVTLISLDGTSREVIFSAPRLYEAPNWSPDGTYLLLNARGRLWRLPLKGRQPEQVPTGAVTGINNDHGISRDGKLFAISAGHVYVLPSAGGTPRQVTRRTPSYYHGWSPDGKTLAYCGLRDGNFDLYSIPVGGGAERRLTSHPAQDDGPDYSPDGKWIYFNSNRSGSWDIWRIPASGAGAGDGPPEGRGAERITSDDWEDWFPHPSRDGKWLVFLSYAKGTQGHPPGKEVVLRIMPLPGDRRPFGKPRELVHLFGGQGTINVNSWAPDSKRFAYVSYSEK